MDKITALCTDKGNVLYPEHLGPKIADVATEDDARFIVKAVNHHDELVEALKGMVTALREQARMARAAGGDIAVCELNGPAWTVARDLLERLGEK